MLEKIKQELKAHSTYYLAGGIGLAVVAALIYFRPKKPTSPEAKLTNSSAKASTRDSRRSDEPESVEKALIRVINSIKRTMTDKDRFDYETVKAIYEGQFELSKSEAQTLIQRNRIERRKVIGDLSAYLDIVASEEEKLEEIHNNHLNAILAHFRLDKAGWMELIEDASNAKKEEWDNLLVEAEEKQLDSLRLPNKPKLKVPVLIEIFKYKAKRLGEKIQEIKEVSKEKSVQPSTLFVAIDKWTDDIVFQKFKIDVEDINYSLGELTEDEKEQVKEFEKEVTDQIENLVLGQQQDDYV